jgi:ribonuclease HI
MRASCDTFDMADRTRPRRRPRRKGGTLKDGERRQLARASRHDGIAAPPPERADRALLLCDGGSRGNPGPSAIAAVLLAPDGQALQQRAEPIGHATAAEAEYRAILLALELAAAHGADPIEIRSDSQLAIAALRSETPAVEHARLVREARAAAGAFTAVRWRWHPRGANEAADALVRELLWP